MFVGKLIIFSAPSGSGKTTIVQHLVKNNEALEFSVSACTRDPRATEVEGKDYYFLSQEEFESNIKKDAFAEYEEVYAGNYYGTLKTEVERIWSEGKHVIFDVDVQGGLKLKEYYKEKALAIFVSVPSFSVLEKRLRSRGTETEESLKTRLSKVREELTFKDEFDKVLLNEYLDSALNQAQYLINDFFNH